MAAAAQKQYVATFAIGAKLLGSFKSVMTAAQSRMKAVNAAAMKAGGALLGFAKKIGGLLSIFGTYAAGHVLSSIFHDALSEAGEAHKRTQSLKYALLENQEIAKGGMAMAEKETAGILEFNKALQEQGVIHHSILDSMAAQLEMRTGMPTDALKQAIPLLADILVESKGVNATMEDGNAIANSYAAAVSKGRLVGLGQRDVTVRKEFAKELQKMVGSQARFNALMKVFDKLYAGRNAAERDTPWGRMHLLENAITDMKEAIGEQLAPAAAQMADAWRAAMPDIGPMLGDALGFIVRQIIRLAYWVKYKLLPELHRLKDFASAQLSPVWDEMGKQFSYMVDQIGPEFGRMLDGLGVKGDDWRAKMGNGVIWALKVTGRLFRWVGDNAKWLVPLVEKVALAFLGLDIALTLAGILNPTTAITVGVFALAIGLAELNDHLDDLRARDDAWGSIARGMKAFDDAFTPNFLKGWVELYHNLGWIYDKAEPIRNGIWNISKAIDDRLIKSLQNLGIELHKLSEPSIIQWLLKQVGLDFPSNVAPPAPLPGSLFAPRTLAPQWKQQSGVSHGPMWTDPKPAAPARAIGPWGQRVSALSNRGADNSVTYAPQITVNGDATPEAQRAMASSLRKATRDFITQFKAAQQQERRLSYESGYA